MFVFGLSECLEFRCGGVHHPHHHTICDTMRTLLASACEHTVLLLSCKALASQKLNTRSAYVWLSLTRPVCEYASVYVVRTRGTQIKNRTRMSLGAHTYTHTNTHARERFLHQQFWMRHLGDVLCEETHTHTHKHHTTYTHTRLTYAWRTLTTPHIKASERAHMAHLCAF